MSTDRKLNFTASTNPIIEQYVIKICSYFKCKMLCSTFWWYQIFLINFIWIVIIWVLLNYCKKSNTRGTVLSKKYSQIIYTPVSKVHFKRKLSYQEKKMNNLSYWHVLTTILKTFKIKKKRLLLDKELLHAHILLVFKNSKRLF